MASAVLHHQAGGRHKADCLRNWGRGVSSRTNVRSGGIATYGGLVVAKEEEEEGMHDPVGKSRSPIEDGNGDEGLGELTGYIEFKSNGKVESKVGH
jgi:hypothetical protein